MERPRGRRDRILLPLPFLTFGDLARQGLEASVYCPSCHRTVRIKVTDELRDRRVVVPERRFRCQGTYVITGRPCGSFGHLAIQSAGSLHEAEAKRARMLRPDRKL
jgi:hypothetical protein